MEKQKNDAAKTKTAKETADKTTKDSPRKPTSTRVKPRPKWPFAILAVGIATLSVGIAVLCVNFLAKPGLRDAEYLVKVGAWQLEDEPSVIWHFAEIGKGTLTTNAHVNDYDFIWSIDDGKLELETTWLYTLNDAYTYQIDQTAGRLVLTSGDGTKTTTFVAGE